MTTTKTIEQIVATEIALVDNEQARHALSRSYGNAAHSLRTIECFFDDFATRRWSEEALCVFLHNWRSPGIGSASFCALTFRLMMHAESAEKPEVRALLYRCASRLAEVSHEDVGIGGINHQILYDDFATRLTGSDAWKLDRYHHGGTKAFLTGSRQYRQHGDDLGYAIVRSLPEELYNYGEFTFVAPRFVRWRKEHLGRPPEGVKDDLKFIHDHLGTTESGHFAALVRGLEDYAAAMDVLPDWTQLYESSYTLITDMAHHYGAIAQRMREEEERAGALAA